MRPDGLRRRREIEGGRGCGGRPVLPAASVKVTLKVSVPFDSAAMSMPLTCCVAEVTLPLPVTGDPPPSLLMPNV